MHEVILNEIHYTKILLSAFDMKGKALHVQGSTMNIPMIHVVGDSFDRLTELVRIVTFVMIVLRYYFAS